MPTFDCLEACRFDLYYRIAWWVQRNRAKELWQSLQLTTLQLSDSRSNSLCGSTITPSSSSASVPSTSLPTYSGTSTLLSSFPPLLLPNATSYVSQSIPSSGDLTFFSFNARSLMPKIDELRALSRIYSPAIIAITETWLSPVVTDSQ